MTWKYSARAMRVAWVGLTLLTVALVFLYLTPLVSLVIGPIAWGVIYYATTMDRRAVRQSADASQVAVGDVPQYRWPNMSTAERSLALIGVLGLAMVLVELLAGKPTALLWAGLTVAASGGLSAQTLFVLRQRKTRS